MTGETAATKTDGAPQVGDRAALSLSFATVTAVSIAIHQYTAV